MRSMSESALSALSGSRSGEKLVAHVWYGGQVVAPNVDVTSWSISTDGARQVRTQVDLTVADPDGRLAPWGVDDPLGVGGAHVQLIYQMNMRDSVDIGMFRITGSEPMEQWVLSRVRDSTGTETAQIWVSGGARIPVKLDDLTAVAAADRMLAPESPAPGATVLSEVRRLLYGVMPVKVAAGVVDKTVASTVVYERERMDAIEDLLDRIDCSHRMTGDGQLEVYPVAAEAPVWEVAGGDDGVLIGVSRSQSAATLYNGAVAEGATPDGVQLIGRAFETSGPLRWEGPHWRRPIFHSATGMLNTQAMVDAAAVTLLRNRLLGRTLTLEVTCLPHPGLQPGDRVTILSPTTTGDDLGLVGRVRAIAMRGTAAGVGPMTMSVDCAYEDVQAVAERVRRGR